jgi:hypothetical protein
LVPARSTSIPSSVLVSATLFRSTAPWLAASTKMPSPPPPALPPVPQQVSDAPRRRHHAHAGDGTAGRSSPPLPAR